ncbi:MAG: hypothetical protein N3C12_05650 [Candidatus Binatia bacterium]|nr:hypothetical protein [Candidatus Binatia bacterium]
MALSSSGHIDHDSVKIECRPSTCGNGRVEWDHEGCDDGNRIDGDGCDRGCRIEQPPTATPSAVPTATPGVVYTPTPWRTPTPDPNSPHLFDPQPTNCGNGTVDAGEDCDDGEVCIGTARAGQACQADADCLTSVDEFRGVCVGGPKLGTLCQLDSDCAPGRCVACRTIGGDGCGADCTSEFASPITFQLVPGVATSFTDRLVAPGSSGFALWGDPVEFALPLEGSHRLGLGKERSGQIPVVIRADSVQYDPIPISTLACACARGVAYRTCGGALFYPSGHLVESCTAGFRAPPAACPPARPCADVFGPGNAAAGDVGCNGLGGVQLVAAQDSLEGFSGGRLRLFLSGLGGPGSWLMGYAVAIGTRIGACDGSFCSPSDPPSERGTPLAFWWTTGQACGVVLNKNDDPAAPAQAHCETGMAVACANLAHGALPGLTLVTGFPVLDQEAIWDFEVTGSFGGAVAHPVSRASGERVRR